MKKIIKLSLAGVCLSIIVGIYPLFKGLYLYSSPATIPLSFSHKKTHNVEFSPKSNTEYFLWIYFQNTPSIENIKQENLDISWEITKDSQQIAKGDTRNLPEITKGSVSRKDRGIAIGSFSAKRGSKYLLSITPYKIKPTWDKTKPYATLETDHWKRLDSFYQTFLAIGSFVLFLTILIIAFLSDKLINRIKKLKNKYLTKKST